MSALRTAHFSRELDRFVIEALRAVKREGGDQALNRTARDLLISLSAILAYERGTDIRILLAARINSLLQCPPACLLTSKAPICFGVHTLLLHRRGSNLAAASGELLASGRIATAF